MRTLFGTDGVRGRAGVFPLNAATVSAIGQAVGERLGGRILVGQDTRMSSPAIYEWLRNGVQRSHASMESAGVIPTPAVALLAREHGFAGGVMISASHNPYEDNGLKVFGPSGAKLDDAAEEQIELRVEELTTGGEEQTDPIGAAPISTENRTGWIERYVDLLLSRFPPGPWLDGLAVVTDCANGAMSRVAPEVFRRAGASVVAMNATPSGTNINAGCGSVHLEALVGVMKGGGAGLGVAFDGDGDRALFVSADGTIVDGDRTLFAMARRMKRAGLLNPPVVVGTVMTNFGLEKALGLEGIRLSRVSVGDRFIFEEMQKGAGSLGGEPSGHVIFPDFGLSGDGLLTALKVAQAVVEDHTPLGSWSHDWELAPQLLKSVPVSRRPPLESAAELQAALRRAQQAIEGRGRIVIRYSGTEPTLRVMVESEDAATNQALMDDLLAAVRADLG
ncbi:MAG TPA: phosphoglucosamine mutase [Terriglobia bacterium]|nr:phosphoglucosamine mutase [Terriglobia bacterium]